MIIDKLKAFQHKSNYINLEFFKVDFWLFLAIVLTATYGCFILFSATNGSEDYLKAQLFRLFLGLCLMVFFSHINPIQFKIWSPILYGFFLFLLCLVPIIGDSALGAKRWLDFYIIRFQPSEFMKIIMPLTLAWFIYNYGIINNLRKILAVGILLLVPVGLIAIQPDLGTAILVLFAGLVIVFLGGISWKIIFSSILSVVCLAPFAWELLRDYQQQRILTLFAPELDPSGAGYHVIQSKIAIGSGGFFGAGWLSGTQSHLNFIPEQRTDFIFSVLGEEMGFLGFIILLLLYSFLIGRLLYITYKLEDTFEKLVSGSISISMCFYVFVNIGMVTGILPVVGVPLPLISYGGTSIITLLVSFGIVSSFYKKKNKIAIKIL